MTEQKFYGKISIEEGQNFEEISSKTAELDVKGPIYSEELNVEGLISADEVKVDHVLTRGVTISHEVPSKTRIRLTSDGANGWFGGNGEEGDIVLFPASGDNKTTAKSTIHLNGGTGDIVAGGSGIDGDLLLKDTSGKNRIRLDANGANGWFGGNGEEGDIVLFPASGDNKTTATSTIHLNGGTGDIVAGGSGINGDLILKDTSGKNRVQLGAHDAKGCFGGNGANGDVLVFAADGDNETFAQRTIGLYGETGNIVAGGAGVDGDLFLKDPSGKNRIQLDANDAKGCFGGNGANGDVLVFAADGDNETFAQRTIGLYGETGNIVAGGAGVDGDLFLKDPSGKNRIHLDANGANGWFGGNGEEGNIVLFPASGDNKTTATSTIHLNGQTGDIILRNADCAEEFAVEDTVKVEPGTVMVLGKEGELCPSTGAYDKKVVGVVSGAGDFKPGLVLDKKPEEANRQPIALMGKVYCKADAQYGAIEVGDLLTTSATPGHAMKASDSTKAFGTILGKALKALDSGQEVIPILVTLQ